MSHLQIIINFVILKLFIDFVRDLTQSFYSHIHEAKVDS